MRKSKFSEHQIVRILKAVEGDRTVKDVCREYGMSSATFYKWRSKFGGMDASLMARMKERERENKQLKRMYADVQLKNEAVMVALAKKW